MKDEGISDSILLRGAWAAQDSQCFCNRLASQLSALPDDSPAFEVQRGPLCHSRNLGFTNDGSQKSHPEALGRLEGFKIGTILGGQREASTSFSIGVEEKGTIRQSFKELD